MRLTVRPGITGWAQINGSTWLNPKEKNEFDEWYVRHASLWLDIKIICITVAVFFGLERRPTQNRFQSSQIRVRNGSNRGDEPPHLSQSFFLS